MIALSFGVVSFLNVQLMIFSVAVWNKLSHSLTLSYIHFVSKWHDVMLYSPLAKVFATIISCSSAVILGSLKGLLSDYLKVSAVAIQLVIGK